MSRRGAEFPVISRWERRSGRLNPGSLDPAHASGQLVVGEETNVQTRIVDPFEGTPYAPGNPTHAGEITLPQTFFLNARHQIVAHTAGAVTAVQLSAGLALMNARTAW
jgi:hypothetical protein